MRGPFGTDVASGSSIRRAAVVVPRAPVGPEERLRAHEEPGEGVVVLGGDRVELVVVAAGAGQRQAEHALADGVDLLVDQVEAELALVPGLVALRPEREIARRDQVPGALIVVLGLEQVAGELLVRNSS